MRYNTGICLIPSFQPCCNGQGKRKSAQKTLLTQVMYHRVFVRSDERATAALDCNCLVPFDCRVLMTSVMQIDSDILPCIPRFSAVMRGADPSSPGSLLCTIIITLNFVGSLDHANKNQAYLIMSTYINSSDDAAFREINLDQEVLNSNKKEVASTPAKRRRLPWDREEPEENTPIKGFMPAKRARSQMKWIQR